MTWPLDAHLHIRRIDAGFPSPAEEWRELELNVYELLVPRPASTLFFCVSGSSMEGAGIHDSDLLIVDRMLTVQHNSIIIALLDGKATVKRLQLRAGTIALKAECKDHLSIARRAAVHCTFVFDLLELSIESMRSTNCLAESKPSGSTKAFLAWTHLGSMGLSQRLWVGEKRRKQDSHTMNPLENTTASAHACMYFFM